MAKAGRPKGEHNKEIICSMRLDEETVRRLNAYCEKLQIRKSEVIREALEQLLDREG